MESDTLGLGFQGRMTQTQEREPLIRREVTERVRCRLLGSSIDFHLPGLASWLAVGLILLAGLLSGAILARVPDHSSATAVALPPDGIISIPSTVLGLVVNVQVRKGDWVTAGQVVAELATGGRVDLLVNQGFSPARIPIRAPAAGRVAQLLVVPGQSISPGDVMVRLLTRDGASELRLFVPADEAGQLRTGQIVLIHDDNDRGTPRRRGRVISISDLPLMPGESPWIAGLSVPVFDVRARWIDEQSESAPRLTGRLFRAEIRHGDYSLLDWWLNRR